MKIKRLSRSIKDAWHGIKFVFLHEQNFRIQIVTGVITILLAWFLHIRIYEFIIIFILIISVLVLELANTVTERLLDLLKPRFHGQILLLKDMTAGMVFLASIGALVIGLIIFVPYLVELFGV